ncbi:MAG: hypothetical protein OHK005_05230 [Candidatus Methylacidiphilales bacterium]
MNSTLSPIPLTLIALTLTTGVLRAETDKRESHPQPPQVEIVSPLGFIPRLEQKIGRRLEPSEKPAVSQALERYRESCRTAFITFSNAIRDSLDIRQPKNALRPARPGLALHPGVNDSDFTEHLVPRLEAMLGRSLKSSEKNRVKKSFEAYQAEVAKARSTLRDDLAKATGVSQEEAQIVAEDASLRPGSIAPKHL